jgi:aminopeptidase N
MRPIRAATAAGLIIAAAGLNIAQDKARPDPVLNLALGPAKLRGKTLTATPGVFLSAAKGKAVPFEKMIGELKRCRLVYVGETHDSLPIHNLQASVVEGLIRAGARISIGLEMLPAGLQPVLDRWSGGELTEDEFIRDARWYLTWNFNFGYYRPIFRLARDNKIPIVALNAPREVIAKIRMMGWDALSDEEKALVPKPGLDNRDHRTLIRTIFESDEIPPQMKGAGLDQMFEALYRAQSAWDEVMAANAVRFVRESGTTMVVLAGSGHLFYNLGINRRAFEAAHWPAATVISVPVPQAEPSVRISRGLADYIHGFVEEARPAFPAVGLSFKAFEGLANLVVDKAPVDGVARTAGFEKGDVVLAVDGRAFGDANELRAYLAGFAWGQESRFRVLRAGAEKEVVLKFEAPAPGSGS